MFMRGGGVFPGPLAPLRDSFPRDTGKGRRSGKNGAWPERSGAHPARAIGVFRGRSERAYLASESRAPRPAGAGGQHDPSSAPGRWRKSRSSSGRRRRQRLMQLCPAGDWRFMAVEDGTRSGEMPGDGEGARAAHSPQRLPDSRWD